jgi:LysM repeat protein
MSKSRCPLLLSTVGLLIVLGLTVGCYREAAPDVTPTPAGGAQVVLPEATLNATEIAATGIANATLAAQPQETPAAETPTTPPPTPTPSPTPEPATPEPTTPPSDTPVPPTPAPTSPPTGQITHVVQPGENMFRIALRYGTTVEAIASANGIANPALIYVGQTLVVPASGAQPPSPPTGETTYVVQPGDNLFRIALRYNLNYLYLAQYNGITDPSHIYVGQIIRIPPH